MVQFKYYFEISVSTIYKPGQTKNREIDLLLYFRRVFCLLSIIHFMNQLKVCLIQFHENYWQPYPPHFIAPFYLFYVERKTQDLEKAFLDSDLLRLMKMAEKKAKKKKDPTNFFSHFNTAQKLHNINGLASCKKV